MRGLVNRRTISALSRSRASAGCFQRQSFSAAGRGRGRSDIEDASIPEFGAGAGGVAASDGAGQGLGLGSFGIGRGRGRGNALPAPPVVSIKPLPAFKPFTLNPVVVAEKPAPSPEVEKIDLADGRFEDVVEETGVKPSQSPLRVSSDALPEARSGDLLKAGGGDLLNVGEGDLSKAGEGGLSKASEADLAKAGGDDVVKAGDADLAKAGGDDVVKAGDADLAKASGGDFAKAGGGDVSEAESTESKRLLSFRGLLNIAPLGGSSPDSEIKVPFNPFNLPTTPSPSIFGGVAGRGRGAPFPQGEGRGRGAARQSREAPIGADTTKGEETTVHLQLSREEARARAMALLAKGEEQRTQRRASPPSPSPSTPTPARPQLSREEAAERAVAVMNEGVERNLSRDEERRRRSGAVDSFADATTMVADRFRRRAPQSVSQQPRGPQSAKDRVKRQPRFTQRRDQEEQPQVPLTLREMTAEDEQRLITLEEEEQFKSSLHSKFLVDFEPEYAMEYFGINPDIDELPQKPLHEILAEAKPFMMIEGMTDEQWEAEVQDVLEKAPHLENLVNVYAGPSRVTAREQVSKLQAVADTLSAHAAPEIKDFMSQAMLTLQSNPGIRMKEKERLMNKFVSTFSSF